MSSFRILEQFSATTKGDKTEDLIVETPHYFGIFDGVTGVRDWQHDNKTMGQWAAQLAGEALREISADASIADFEKLATQRLAAARQKFSLAPADRLATTAIVLPRRKPLEIWCIGDSHYGFRLRDGSWHARPQNKIYDNFTYSYRSVIASQEILEKGTPQTAAARGALAKLARESINSALSKQMLWANHADDTQKLGFGVLNGTPVPEHFRLCHPLPANTAEVVLCSDGFPEPAEASAIGVAMIKKLREADPFLIGTNEWGFLGAKGFVQFDGTVADWYDDVSYLRIAT